MKKWCICLLLLLTLAGFMFAKNIDATRGKVRLKIHGSSGSFSVYVFGPNEKQHSMFSQTVQSTATFFSVKIDEHVYRLLNEHHVKARASATKDGAKITYTIKNIAVVVLEFTFVESIPGLPADALRMTLNVKNTSASDQQFAVKGIFDTDIGEVEGPIFVTAVNPAIKNETELAAMEYHQWILVSNVYCSLRMLLYGYDITVPASAAIANKTALSSGEWDISKHLGRSFSSFSAFNDAAVELKWPSGILKPREEQQINMYLSMSAEITPPATSVFVEAQAAKAGTQSTLQTPAQVSTQTTGNDRVVQFLSVNNISAEQIVAAQLDPAYIENLLARILELELRGSEADPEEVRVLSAELDAILSRIRR
jgi:hypothetical protein